MAHAWQDNGRRMLGQGAREERGIQGTGLRHREGVGDAGGRRRQTRGQEAADDIAVRRPACARMRRRPENASARP